MRTIHNKLLVLGAVCAAMQINVARAAVVDVELALLVDDSGSISSTEWDIQLQGYRNAFYDPVIGNALDAGASAAVTFIAWADGTHQNQMLGWTVLNTSTEAQAFGDLILGLSEPFSGGTAPGSAINYAVPLFSSDPNYSDRQVIDVSGDGVENSGADTSDARDAALTAGIDQINGLALLTDDLDLDVWYGDNVVGGVGSFTVPVNTFSEFEAGITTKLRAEITGTDPIIPEPVSLLGLGGLLFLGLLHRNRR